MSHENQNYRFSFIFESLIKACYTSFAFLKFVSILRDTNNVFRPHSGSQLRNNELYVQSVLASTKCCESVKKVDKIHSLLVFNKTSECCMFVRMSVSVYVFITNQSGRLIDLGFVI